MSSIVIGILVFTNCITLLMLIGAIEMLRNIGALKSHDLEEARKILNEIEEPQFIVVTQFKLPKEIQ